MLVVVSGWWVMRGGDGEGYGGGGGGGGACPGEVWHVVVVVSEW